MQYLLTQEEMDKVNKKVSPEVVSALKETIDKMREIIMYNNDEGCIHSKQRQPMYYCDDCPLANIPNACTLDKDFSQ